MKDANVSSVSIGVTITESRAVK